MKFNNDCICICMCMHNNASSIEKAIHSVLAQNKTKRELYIIISDDASTDGSIEIVKSLQLTYQQIQLHQNNFNSVSKNRNWLQNHVIENFPNCILLGRLDADDTLADTDILQKIESLWDTKHFDVLLMANSQIKDGLETGCINRPDVDLLNPQLLVERLDKMSQGIWEAELPSCNVYVRPQIAIPYKQINSAEDHWNLVDYLLRNQELNIYIEPNWIYSHYHIYGSLSSLNNQSGERLKSRKALYEYALNKTQENMRKRNALSLLLKHKEGTYQYLGAGFSGVVFHDETWVYKVHLPLATNNFNEISHILFLKEKLREFDGRMHFFPLKDLIKVGDTYILIYPYEKGESVTSLTAEEIIGFLAEMWSMKLMCRSITKENNFIRVNCVVKLIDYEIEPYNDNLFLNLAARAFIQLNNRAYEYFNYEKLKRSTINQFQLPELVGFYDFLEKVFTTIADKSIYQLANESSSNLSEQTIDIIEYNGVENPSVCLLIKACIQDSATIYNDVKFIIEQLPKKVNFKERVLCIDTYKSTDFLRQYTDKGDLEELIQSANKLIADGIIHRIIASPNSTTEIENLNKKYFGVSSSATHTQVGVPITAQLYAFEQTTCDYILQLDEDILIGKKNNKHDFLKKPIAALQSNSKAITWGFQIYQDNANGFQSFIGNDGTVPPDPRCCLIDRQRLNDIYPLNNTLLSNGWELSWYRALQQHHQNQKSCSLRVGDTDTFYAHIQNYRKENRWVWWTIMQAYKNNLLPSKQIGYPEVMGTIFDWTFPKRNEHLVLVLVINKINIEATKKTVFSIFNQDTDAFGLILYNNSGDDRIHSFIQQLPSNIYNRITLIESEHHIPENEAIYKAIHYYITNAESFVCIVKEGDLILGNTVLSECLNRLKLYEADVLVGKEFSTYTFSQNGMWASDFLHPREQPETLLNGLYIFRKYLFDALSHLDLKQQNEQAENHLPGYTKIKKAYQWLDDATSLSIMVPIIELSKNPIRFDHYNILRTNTPAREEINLITQFLQTKTPKKEGAWEIGRKTFLPNTNRIELDITYDCNLKCTHCNRSCTQAPTQSHMTLEQVQQFVNESVMLDKKWEIINILGGEPALHPEFEAIVNCLLNTYIIPFATKTTLQITSNGYGSQVQAKLQALPKHPNLVVNTNSFKTGREIPYFTPFNKAPIDEMGSQENYHKGCWVTAYCGIGLNHLGYFACGVAGGIERIMHAGGGIQSLALLDEQLLQKQLQTYCSLCGNFSDYAVNRGDFMERAEKEVAPKTAMSETWKKLYKQYNNESN